ncbi:MAG: replication-associated recombination protein A [Desulfofustis sp.]|nr:replication-associated recombination protein A [Desulfofustis sp.]
MPELNSPLADRMRPDTLDGFFGQEKLVGEGRILRQLLQEDSLPSLILWGPPGSGKTSLAKIISAATDADFVFFSAVLSGVKEVRQIVEVAKVKLTQDHLKTLLFVDEIHRFNKSQQDAFLPHVESGLLTLIGATTENPSFQVTAPLLSRCRVLVLEPLSPETLAQIIQQALNDREKGLGSHSLQLEEQAGKLLIEAADGDARNALNILELASKLALQRLREDSRDALISVIDIEEASQTRTLRYDKDGEEHFNLISALHKSLRDSDPDGSLYWYYRMIEGGEDPLYIARRLIRFASEDIGIADPQAMVQAVAGRDAYHMLGCPEGELALAQVVVYLATAPKSNGVYTASKAVRALIQQTGSLPVPLHIRNAPTQLMKELGYGKGYVYAHDSPEGLVDQNHLPDDLSGKRFYFPVNRGYEAVVKDRLEKWRKILRKNKK